MVLFNFRGDRAIEITRAFEERRRSSEFDRERVPDVLFAGMMEYDGDLHVPKHYLVHAAAIERTLGEYLGAQRRRASSRSARRRSSATSPTSGTATAAACSTTRSRRTSRSRATACRSTSGRG